MHRTSFIALLSGLMFFTLFSSLVGAKQIIVSGSTSVARIMDVLAEDYNTTHPGNDIAVQAIGSTAGITLLKKGVVNIAMVSRYLTESEMDPSLEVDLLAYDGLAIVVNNSNPVTNLTRDELYKIYKGEITNWNQVGGPDKKIIAVTREAASGTRFSFESMVGLTKVVNDRLVSDSNPSHLVVNSNSMVKTLVNHNPQAMGYISTGSVDNSVKPTLFEGLAATLDTISDGRYQLSRPFLILSYPQKDTEDTRKFIEYLKSEQVRMLVTKYGYIPTIK